MSTEVRELVRDAAPQPSRPLDVEELWANGRRQRRRRIVGAVGVVVMLVAIAVGVPALLSQDAGPVTPEIVDQPTIHDQVPAGWKTLRVGEAAFSVPAAWPVKTIHGPDDAMPCLERLTTNDTRVWLADRLWQPPCGPADPDPSPGQGQVSVYAFPASGGEGRGSVDVDVVLEEAARIAEHGQAVQLPGGEAMMVETDHLRSYLFAELDAVLMIAHRPNVELAEQIALTVRPTGHPPEQGVGDSGSEPGTANEVLGKWEGGPRGSAFLSVAWTDSAVAVAALWDTFGLDDPPPPMPEGQAVLLVATGESGSCPAQLTNVAFDDGQIELELTEGPDVFPVPSDYVCTSDFNPITFAITTDADLLAARPTVTLNDTTVRLGGPNQIVTADYGEQPSLDSS